MVTASQALAAVRLTARELSPPSPRRALAMAASIISILAFARIACSVLEAYSQVRGERLADAELMQMCAERAGKGSADFRALCLKKRAEQASPVIFKALLRACSSAFQDFAESMSSPTKVLLLILFCFTGVAAPVVKAGSTLLVDQFKRRRHRRGCHRPGRRCPRPRLPRHLRRFPTRAHRRRARRRRARRHPPPRHRRHRGWTWTR